MSGPTPTLGGSLRNGLRLIAGFVKRHPISFTLAAGGAALFAGSIVAAAYVIGWATDDVIVPVLQDGEAIDGRLRPAVLGILAVAVWKAIAITLRRTAAGYLQYRSQADVRLDLIDRILRLELAWYRRQSTGDLLAVTDADASQATFILAPMPFGTGASVLLIGTVAVIFTMDPLLSLVVLVSLAAIVAIDVSGSWKMFSAFQDVQLVRGEVGRVAHESFDGALTVKALGRADQETARFAAVSERLRGLLAHVGVVFSSYRVLVEGLLSMVTVVTLIVGAMRIQAGAVSPGEVVTVAYLLSLLFIPIRIIGFVLWDMAHSTAAWERVQSVMRSDEVVAYGNLTSRALPAGAAVQGAAIGFGYEPATPVLSDVAVAIPSGRVVAVVGPTGSGKSTLVALMARLWDPDAGAILIDGADLRDFARSALPGEVAYVSQDGFLFDDTVAGNVGFGAEATHEELETAAQMAGATDFIAALPDGWQTMLGERGTTLSGGQRQRIALARALVRRPRLLILDDATSAVDPSIETQILERLRNAALPSTVVIVAYRRSSIMLADEILYVDEGRVVANGSHEDLLATVPGYAAILEAYDEDAADRNPPRPGVEP